MAAISIAVTTHAGRLHTCNRSGCWTTCAPLHPRAVAALRGKRLHVALSWPLDARVTLAGSPIAGAEGTLGAGWTWDAGLDGHRWWLRIVVDGLALDLSWSLSKLSGSRRAPGVAPATVRPASEAT